MQENRRYQRGDFYLADLNPSFGSEQGGIRPVLVIQNNIGNRYCPTLIVVPITSHVLKKPNQPTHFLLENEGGLSRPAMAMTEQIKTIDKNRIRKYLGKVSRQTMDELDKCLEVSLALSQRNITNASCGQM